MRGRVSAVLMILVAVGAALAVWSGAWWSGARWRGELYCFADPGRVWGAAPRPADARPSCPASRSVRREVREGRTRVEQFTLPTWAPDAIRDLLTAQGFTVTHALPDDGVQAEAVLIREGETVLYSAAHLGRGTFVTLGAVGRHAP